MMSIFQRSVFRMNIFCKKKKKNGSSKVIRSTNNINMIALFIILKTMYLFIRKNKQLLFKRMPLFLSNIYFSANINEHNTQQCTVLKFYLLNMLITLICMYSTDYHLHVFQCCPNICQ